MANIDRDSSVYRILAQSFLDLANIMQTKQNMFENVVGTLPMIIEDQVAVKPFINRMNNHLKDLQQVVEAMNDMSEQLTVAANYIDRVRNIKL